MVVLAGWAGRRDIAEGGSLIPAALALFLGLSAGAGTPTADEHLLAGARDFREGRYESALVEFRVAQDLGSTDASAYAGATLVKLDRPDEALEAFGPDDAPAGDSLLEYFRALACYDARLYLCADRVLSSLGTRAGPQVAAQAAKIREAISAALSQEPTHTDIDWYLERCSALTAAHRPAAAAAYCREAAGLADRRGDAYRRRDALAGLARLGTAPRGGAAR